MEVAVCGAHQQVLLEGLQTSEKEEMTCRNERRGSKEKEKKTNGVGDRKRKQTGVVGRKGGNQITNGRVLEDSGLVISQLCILSEA